MAGFTHENGSCFCARKECSIECNTYAKYGPKRKTNADRIRSMSDEELAEWFYSGDFPWCVYEKDVVPCTYEDIPVHPCDRCLLDWLKQEVK